MNGLKILRHSPFPHLLVLSPKKYTKHIEHVYKIMCKMHVKFKNVLLRLQKRNAFYRELWNHGSYMPSTASIYTELIVRFTVNLVPLSCQCIISHHISRLLARDLYDLYILHRKSYSPLPFSK